MSARTPGGAGGDPVTFTQPDRRFKGSAYRYVRAADRLPTLEQLGDDPDALCRVKLFVPSGSWTYYIGAVTRYGEETVITGVGVLGPGNFSWGDTSLDEIAALRVMGLPPERDLSFKPMRRSEIGRLLEASTTP